MCDLASAAERGDDVPLVMVTVTCNNNGGQPVSLENLRAGRALCDRYGKPMFLDAARFAENAWFIKTREPGQDTRTPRAIAREMFDLAEAGAVAFSDDGMSIMDANLMRRVTTWRDGEIG